MEIVDKIVEAHPNLLKQITLKHLCETIKPAPSKVLMDSLLIVWLESKKGQVLLEKWLIEHPEDNAKVEDHISEYRRKKSEKESPSPLASLSIHVPSLSMFASEKKENQDSISLPFLLK